MIKNLVHDPIFLAGKSEPATKDDLFVALLSILNISGKNSLASSLRTSCRILQM